MIKHIWSVLCRESLINKDDNNITLQSILEQLNVSIKSKDDSDTKKQPINVPIGYEVVSLWVKEENSDEPKAQVEITLLDPTRKELHRVEQTLIFVKPYKRMRSRFKIAGFPITGSGVYTFRVGIKEEGNRLFKVVSEIPVEVNIEPASS